MIAEKLILGRNFLNISSMTGFCRTCGRYADENTSFDLAFEIKSVNGKNLDFKIISTYHFKYAI